MISFDARGANWTGGRNVNKKNVVRRAWFCAVIGLALIMAAGAGAQTPATLTDSGGTAPTPGPNDLSELLTTGQADMPDGLNYYTDNQSNHGAGEPGQTFTTLNAP